MAGNGGQMAGKFEAELKRAEQKEKLAQVKAVAKADARAEAKATVRARAKANRGYTSKKAAASLCNAASKAVADNSMDLSEFLLKTTYGGNITSAKLLISLSAPAKADKDTGKKRSGRSLAIDLAAEPVWQEPMTEAAAETNAWNR